MTQSIVQPNAVQPRSGTIQVQVNGDMQAFPQGATCADLVEQLSLGSSQRFAVERNGQIVPRSQLANVVLEEGDRVEVIQAIGGG